jgi:tRNA (guanine37-N1)-methyltransferase
MHFSLISLFPETFVEPLKVGVVGQSFEKGRVTYSHINPREFGAPGVHKAVDDKPFGGGDGMVMAAEPLAKSIEKAKQEQVGAKTVVINFTPQGRPLNQGILRELASSDHLILICGRYAGIDQRLTNSMVDLELSVGDFVVSGGEIPALLLIDGICRLLPNTLGNELSAVDDTFSIDSVFEAPLYTRPADWRGQKVPDTLLSGHHTKIEEYRRKVGLARALLGRPELTRHLSEKTIQSTRAFIDQLNPDERRILGLTEPKI